MSLSTRAAEPSTSRRPLGEQEKPESGRGAFPALPHKGKPSLDEISKLFSVPIAEAASILGVSDSLLKRICRENGIVRWPYRKFISGKAIEDIKKDATWEKNKGVDGSFEKESIHVSTRATSTSTGIATYIGDYTRPELQPGMPMAGQALSAQGNRFIQYGWSGIPQPIQPRNISTYMDKFEHGFPSDGLSSVSLKWWGNGDGEASTTPLPQASDNEQAKLERAAGSTRQERFDSNTEDSNIENDPSASLCLLRKRSAECGHQALKNGFFIGWDSCCLTKRRKLLLSRVFEASVFSQWKDNTNNL